MLPLIIGGALAAGGALSNYMSNRQNAANLSAAYDRITGMGDEAAKQNAADIAAYQQQLQDTYGANASSYNEALQKFLNSPVYQNKEFSYTGDINDFLDPAMNQRVDAAMGAIYNNALIGKASAMASEEWEKAYNKLMQDKQQQMAQWNANSQNAWNNYNANQQQLGNAVNLYGQDRNALAQGNAEAIMAQMNNRNANLQTQANAIAGKANAQQGTSGWDLAGGLFGAGSNFLSNYFGG